MKSKLVNLFLFSWLEKMFKWIENLLKCTEIICNGVLLKMLWLLVVIMILTSIGIAIGLTKNLNCKNGYSGISCENCLYFKLII